MLSLSEWTSYMVCLSTIFFSVNDSREEEGLY